MHFFCYRYRNLFIETKLFNIFLLFYCNKDEENREQALKDFEKFNKKVQNLARKQDQLLKG